MPRETVDFEVLDPAELAKAPLDKPVRLVCPNPQRGGPRIAALREALAPRGRVRISATPARTFIDFDPGEPEPPLVALDTIARSDAAGLERMLLSVLPHVDEVVLGEVLIKQEEPAVHLPPLPRHLKATFSYHLEDVSHGAVAVKCLKMSQHHSLTDLRGDHTHS